jgi:DNA modification methylase
MMTDVIDQEIGKNFALYHGDCVEVMGGIPDNSVHFSVYSPPFSNLYIYSDDTRDMGNSASDDEFFEHYQFLLRELFRATMPGRLTAVHCKDLPFYHNRDGWAGLNDFPAKVARAHEECGWVLHSKVTIWKDPVTEMQRTKNHGLLHKNFTQRAEVCRQGMADYLYVFRKWEGVEGTESLEPVHHNLKARRHEFIGSEPPTNYENDRDYSIQVWQRYASPVWFDIDQQRVLNFQIARDDRDEKHICPLQLDVIERSIDLWTNPGDIVLSPFAGIGSEGYCAVKQGRKFIGAELKESYFRVAARNLHKAEEESQQMDMFAIHQEAALPAD